MTDMLFLLGTVLAFGVFVLLLRGCEKIVGVEPLPQTTDHPDTTEPDRGDLVAS